MSTITHIEKEELVNADSVSAIINKKISVYVITGGVACGKTHLATVVRNAIEQKSGVATMIDEIPDDYRPAIIELLKVATMMRPLILVSQSYIDLGDLIKLKINEGSAILLCGTAHGAKDVKHISDKHGISGSRLIKLPARKFAVIRQAI